MPAVEHSQTVSAQDDGEGGAETSQSRAAFVRARNRAYQALYRARFKVRCYAAVELLLHLLSWCSQTDLSALYVETHSWQWDEPRCDWARWIRLPSDTVAVLRRRH